MVKLHFNESALRYVAQSRPPDREGRLLYRKSSDSYKERWFRLYGNLLFYFRTNDLGAVADASDPLGVLVLAKCRVQMEAFGDRPFVFSIIFDGEEGRKHFFSGQSQQLCEEWISAVQNFSYSSLRLQLETLRQRVQQMTGRDQLADAQFKPVSNTIKRQPPRVPPPPSSHRAATFYVETVAGTSEQCGTSFTIKPPVSSESTKLAPPARPARPSRDRSGISNVQTLQNSTGSLPRIVASGSDTDNKILASTGSLPRTTAAASSKGDVKEPPTTNSKFYSWEKFS
jgi:hypothetical protein